MFQQCAFPTYKKCFHCLSSMSSSLVQLSAIWSVLLKAISLFLRVHLTMQIMNPCWAIPTLGDVENISTWPRRRTSNLEGLEISMLMHTSRSISSISSLYANGLLSPRQSGFRVRHSTATSLLKCTYDLYNWLDTAQMTRLVFNKAFDIVDHEVLSKKLFFYSVQNRELEWIKSCRKQFTRVNGGGSKSRRD